MILSLNPYYNINNQSQNFKKFLAFACLIHLVFFISSSKIFSVFDFSAQSPLVFEATKTIDLNLSSLKQEEVLTKTNLKPLTKTLKNPLITDKIDKTLTKEDSGKKTSADANSVSRAQPFAKNKIFANYPPLAEEMQIEGTVYMKFLVNEIGKVLDVKVTKSSGSKLLDNAAVKALKTADNFSPAKDKSGKAISSWGEYTINFSLTEDS